ncbi:MAG: fumarate/nitrate reduction transcriptional regulator Fnr [Burkholderiales bacterium]|nr:MAG: fumarate/nitrate reduction transcriptional regulator Fnr [Burkholderiales bacterium]
MNKPIRVACAECTVRDLCLPPGLSSQEIEEVEAIVGTRRKIKRYQELFHAGDGFGSLYAIRVGSFKTRVTTQDGREQVTGFRMAGEILGLDGIGLQRHACDAVALEDSEVCVIPFEQLEELSREHTALQHHFHRVMSRELVNDQGLMLLLGNMRAEERLATFLLNMSERMRARGFSPNSFVLRMSRQEIGSYLGLKLETVSRAFSRFNEMGMVEVSQREIRLKDTGALRSMVEHCTGT